MTTFKESDSLQRMTRLFLVVLFILMGTMAAPSPAFYKPDHPDTYLGQQPQELSTAPLFLEKSGVKDQVQLVVTGFLTPSLFSSRVEISALSIRIITAGSPTLQSCLIYTQDTASRL